jgi:tetratricopeptide (TPR) repeat protein
MSATNSGQFAELFREGTRYIHQGKPNAARPLLEKALELDPDHVDVAINLSGVYILTKKFKKAVKLLEPFSQQHPDHVMIWTNLGAAYLGNPVLARNEEQLQAIAAFTKAIEVNPATPNVAYNIGLIHRDRQEIDKAIHWFQRAIQTNPSDKDARSLLQKLQAGESQN